MGVGYFSVISSIRAGGVAAWCWEEKNLTRWFAITFFKTYHDDFRAEKIVIRRFCFLSSAAFSSFNNYVQKRKQKKKEIEKDLKEIIGL